MIKGDQYKTKDMDLVKDAIIASIEGFIEGEFKRIDLTSKKEKNDIVFTVKRTFSTEKEA